MLYKTDGWRLRDPLAKLKPEEYQSIRETMGKLALPEDQEKLKEYYDTVCLTDEELNLLETYGIRELEIKRVPGLYYGPKVPRTDIQQQIYQFHVSNVGLLEINKLSYHEDCCTDVIQDMLDQGWKIIAVCPPNDARRPTYIMGRKE